MEQQRKIYPGIAYSDPSYRSDDASRYALHMFLNDAQLLFCVRDGAVLMHLQSYNFFQVNGAREFEDSVKSVLASDDLFNQTFASASLALYHEHNTLVPDALFDAEHAASYLQLNLEDGDGMQSAYDFVTAQGIVNVYYRPAALVQLFQNKFPNLNIAHAATPLLRYLLQQDSGNETVYVYVQPRLLQMACVKNGKLVFFNAFEYTTPEDFVYYVLYVCQHLHLDTETVPVQLLGEVVKDSVLYEFAYKYIRNVTFGKRPSGVTVHTDFQMPEHFYYNLFCIEA